MHMLQIIKFGLQNSCRLDIVYHKFFRHQKLRINLIKSFASNVLMITQWYIIYYLLTAKLMLEHDYVLSNLVTSGFIVFITPMFILNILMNHHWRQQIVQEIKDKVKGKLKQKSSDNVITNLTDLRMYILNMIYNYFSSIWFYNLNNIIILIAYHCLGLVGLSLIAVVVKLLYTSLISSMYACEYMLNSNSLTKRINFAEKNWCYLVAWNLPTVTFFWLVGLPFIVQWALMEFWTMCQMICCLYIQIPDSQHTDMPIMAVQRRIVPIVTNTTLQVLSSAFNKSVQKKIE